MRERAASLFAWGRRISAQYTACRISLAAGGLAYFVALSLAPAAFALGTVAGVFLDPEDVRATLTRLTDRSSESLGQAQSAIDALVGLIEGASGATLTVATMVSAVVAVYAASKVVYGVRMAMNSVFGVIEERSGLIERAFSTFFTLLGLIGAVGVVVVLTVVPRVLSWLGIGGFSTLSGIWVVDVLVALAAVFLTVRWVLRHGPTGGASIPWLSPGVALASVWIVIVTGGVGLYASLSTSLGAAVLLFGTAVVILLWLYLCFVGLMYGALIEADRLVRTRTSEGDRPPVR